MRQGGRRGWRYSAQSQLQEVARKLCASKDTQQLVPSDLICLCPADSIYSNDFPAAANSSQTLSLA